MLSDMWQNKMLYYLGYGASFILITELVYKLYVAFDKKTRNTQTSVGNNPKDAKDNNDDSEIIEVFWTNELTQSCSCKSVLIVQNCPKPYCASNNIGRLIWYIDNAKYCIDLAMYTFSSYELSQAFVRAIKRRVLVRIINDTEMVHTSGSQIMALTNNGALVRNPPKTKMLMHHKFCILDGPLRLATLQKRGMKLTATPRGLVMTGSLNWTGQGLSSNWENVLLTSNKKVVNEYEKEFQRMWEAFEDEVDAEKKHTKEATKL